MAGNIPYLFLEKTGAYFFRRRYPKIAKEYFGQEMFSKALGRSKREAQQRHPQALAEFNEKVQQAESAASGATVLTTSKPDRQLTAEQMGAQRYQERVQFDEQARNSDDRYARMGAFDEQKIANLKAIRAGSASNADILAEHGWTYEYYRRLGHIPAEIGSSEWRQTMRAINEGEIEALKRACAVDEGDEPPPPPAWITDALSELEKPAEAASQSQEPSIRKLFERWRAVSRTGDEETATCRRYRPAIESFIQHLGHDDAQRVTNRDVSAWAEHLLTKEGKAHSTVKKIHLVSVSGMLHWASDNSLINPIKIKARVKAPKQQLSRGKGYTEGEASKILHAAQAYKPDPDSKESEHLSNAKRWLPWLAAFTGARIGELAQLRKEDVQERDDIHFVLLTPDAGTIKNGHYREVPLHPQLIELGFLKFVGASGSGPLFHGKAKNGKTTRQPSENTGKRLAAWLRSEGLAPLGVAPNHGFRHRFKTISIELELSGRVIDAIQGHSSGRAGDNYGDVTLAAKSNAVQKLPNIKLANRV
ncbi:tyrosine-type recombinase/integrase [Roseibium sp.]|uniref:tyrosine-type recombinase/integrase n=1 Tax=Roseibium sp. TaxID=1936156 RepID=UPI0039F0CEFD